ncbi:outer membrane receptor protein involved in Fe transport [Altererythrobacter atlanticus]|uniref:TonB-dependent receptor domain-containing protein n=1 Tax=Croceibacterium atlanticum TaxID=1267766 RepID=UPI0006B34357|nr:TonB-dependent receptor [Croceibacterium atlanticum]MBB5732076.1 outer membrane receptor protein involved in Fe transport [Croceibacterium atlanticum]
MAAFLPGSLAAQDAVPSSEENAASIVVTGSRIVRDGYEAPTPTTVLGAEEILTNAPNNIADLVNRLPALAGSATPRTNLGQISNGGTGINALNLRNLGPQRTLILLDGKRVPVATINTGLVDVNFMPNLLMERVDIVTGGASAAWGSDAVAGVVNFVLDKDFTGIKGDVQGGITTHGDDENYRIGLAAGTSFGDGRGHFLISGEHAFSAGLDGLPRSWYTGAKRFRNPDYTADNGQPEWLVLENTGFSTIAPGAIVTKGPLRGLYFGENGVPAQLNMGDTVFDPFMTGGDWEYTDFGKGIQDMDPRISRQSLFARLSYQLSDRVEAYSQFSYGRASTSMRSTPQFNFGGITIQRDNAFLPEEIGLRMDELGLTSLDVGSWNADLGGIQTDTRRSQYRYLLGFTGGLDLFGTDWGWDISANRNVSKIFNGSNAAITARYRGGIDSVRDENGVIVCRSTLTNPNDGCVPFNILGTGTVSDAAKNHVLGDNRLRGTLTQDIFTASLDGEPFATWAGPVSVAAGVEHRREKLRSHVDELSLVNSYWAGNYKPINGKYNVTEAFLETVVPLALGESWAEELSINAAIRGTDYSTSGFVTTWKIGANYEPVDGLRLRATRSRDIRAGNFSELYASGQTNTYLISDPFRDNEPVSYFEIRSGNPGLKPEKGDTLNIGVVLQPNFAPGFSASVDFFDIKVKDAVATVGAGTILNECYRGDTTLCGLIKRNAAGLITEIYVSPVNLARRSVRGMDFEAAYSLELSDLSSSLGGNFTLRGLATRYTRAQSDNGVAAPSSSLGANNGGTPKWQYMVQGTYRDDRLTASLTGRGLSSGVYMTNGIECAANCPASTPENPTTNRNRIDGALYLDAFIGFDMSETTELYLAIDNLADKAPPVVGSGPGIGSAPYGSSATYYDLIGRMFRAGVRFNF